MKKRNLIKTKAPVALCAGLCLAGGTLPALAQLTGEQAGLLRNAIGNRSELGTILGGSDTIGGGNFTIDADNNQDLDYSLMKFSGRGEIGDPRALGNTGMRWNPFVRGSFGWLNGENDITFGTLNGNSITTDIYAVALAGGVAFYINDHLKITPSIGVIYGHSELDFDAKNPNGVAAKPLLDTKLDTIGSTPSLNVAYKFPVGTVSLELSSQYTLYATSDISSEDDSHGIKANGTTHVWENKIDVDIPLNVELWTCRLHTGGFISHTVLFGDITDTMRADNFFTFHPRIMLNTEGKLWKVSDIGVGGSYYYGSNLNGWTVGIDFNMKF